MIRAYGRLAACGEVQAILSRREGVGDSRRSVDPAHRARAHSRSHRFNEIKRGLPESRARCWRRLPGTSKTRASSNASLTAKVTGCPPFSKAGHLKDGH